jgi:N-glycosylase/DNA lyase
VTGTAKALQEKPGGGEKWFASLRQMEPGTIIDALCTLPGVGPKVAACIALFSLDQHHAVPVDTHVWKVNIFLQFSCCSSILVNVAYFFRKQFCLLM